MCSTKHVQSFARWQFALNFVKYLLVSCLFQDFCHFLLLPFTLLTASNIITIYHLAKRQKSLRNLNATERQYDESNQSDYYALAGLLVSVSLAFIVLKLPAFVLHWRVLTDVQTKPGKFSHLFVLRLDSGLNFRQRNHVELVSVTLRYKLLLQKFSPN